MEKIYNPKNIEELIYSFWETKQCFNPHKNTTKENYCITMPPPNITGQLHLGHAFQQTIMDILIRYQRMQGKNTLWTMGTDHAGIAAQILVEKKHLSEIQIAKKHFTQKELIEKMWKWKKQNEIYITNQIKKLGNSVNWENTHFTMDTEMSYAVKEAFIRLYQDNLIYKGKRLVNWDPSLKSAISDLEVSNKQITGSIWYIRYQLENIICNYSKTKHNFLVVATTRPETILGDTAVAVHPNDSRYNTLIGQHVLTPITNRRIPIIFDKRISMKTGTGCVKITPAHDFNDYIIGKIHNLPMINIFSESGTILKKPEIFNNSETLNNQSYNTIPKIFQNLNYSQARKQIILECEKLNLLQKTELHNFTVPYNNRTETIIEPRLTNQWYIRTKILAKQAINVIQTNIIKLIPKQYKNMYFSWMHNIQDWCISRQIWWGHKIPAWYTKDNQIYVGYSEKDIRNVNKLPDHLKLYRDQDVLDTWFSSSLWTFASLGWPKQTNLLKIFHPTNVIVSGFDIIFFWIARMIMLTMYLIKDQHGQPQIPFKTIYITGLIRDEFGKKMSKSKGNIIDPLDIIDGISLPHLLKKRTHDILQLQLSKKIEKYTQKQFPNGIKPYGADSLRFTLTALASSGRDIHWDMKRLEGYHNFCNKLWHASRFVLMHTKYKDCGIQYSTQKIFSLSDKWILTKFQQTVKKFHLILSQYRFDKIAYILHEFIWHQFCDWYLEFTKPTILFGNQLEIRGTRYTLITLLDSLLKLAHPIIPFITEKIWQETKIITKNNSKSIMLEPFPQYNASKIDLQAFTDIEWIKKIITKIRTIRTNIHLIHNIPLQIICKTNSLEIKKRIQNNYHILHKIANLKNIYIDSKNTTEYPRTLSIMVDQTELLVQIPKIFNKNATILRLQKELKIINNKIYEIQKILNTDHFIHNAPKLIILKKQKQLNLHINTKKQLLIQYNTIIIL